MANLLSTSVTGTINSTGNTTAAGFTGNANVGGTGAATWHPSGIYSGGTQWLYGTTYRNNASTSGQGQMYFDGNYGYGMVGLYSDVRYQAVFAMGDAYKLPVDGTGPGNLYGIAWTHSNIGAESKAGLGHQALFMMSGRTYTAIGSGIWTDGTITTTSHGTSANWNTAYSYGNHASAGYLTSIPAHTHTIANVTGLQTALDGKQAAGSYLTTSGKAADSNLLDGLDLHTGTNNEANKVVRTDVNGYINAGWINTISGDRGTVAPIRIYASNDAYIRYYTPANFISVLGLITTSNIGSQSVANADTVDGFHASVAGTANTIPTRNASGYLIPENWIQLNGSYGLYSPTNNAHLYPNNGTYGSWRIDGTRNGWNGLEFNASNGNVVLMVNPGSNTTGFHNNSYGWQFYWEGGTLYCFKNTYGGGTQATVLDSVNYTSFAAAASGNTGNEFGARSFFFPASNFNPSTAPREGLSSMSVKMWNNYFNGSGLGSDYGTVMEYYSLSGHVDTQVYFDAGGGSWYRTSAYNQGWQGWQNYLTSSNFTTYAQEKENQRLSTGSDVTHNSTTSPLLLVNNHSDNTKGYRIHNTSGSSVSAMFTNSSNQLVIAAGAVDQINLNKKVLVNAVALGVNFAPSATAGRIDASNDIVAFNSSDERLKENITPIANALDKVKSLTGVEFDWKPEHKEAHGHEGRDTGIIAQQVLVVMPTAVRTNDTGFLAVRYEKLIGLLIEGMKEQQEQIDQLKVQINGLTK